jgi:WS/DGAT/MGAT family acyltransferase
MTAIRILSEAVLDSEPPAKPAERREGPLDAPGSAELLAMGARDRALGVAASAGRAALALGSPSAWRQAAVTAWRVPGTVRRDLLPGSRSSPLDAPAGSERVVAFVSRPLEDLRRIAKAFATGVTINDVVLAATAGGLRHWLEREGRPVGDLRAKVPVSLHQPGEPAAAAANRDSFMVVGLGLEHRDPVERLLAINAETRDRKRHQDAQEIDALLQDLAHVSRSLERLAQRWAVGYRVFAVNVSNVPGPAGSLSLLGAPVRELYSVAEIANRHALRVSAISAGGRLAFGLCADPAAVHDVDALASGLGRELDELLART